MEGMSVEEPGQSACYHRRKTRVFCISYHVVLTALTVTSTTLSIYAVHRLTTEGNGATDLPQKPHPVHGNTDYRMWSLVGMSNDGLMVLNPSGSNFYCNGSFSGSGSGQGLSTVTTSAISIGEGNVSLLFNNRGQQYVLTVNTATQNDVQALQFAGGSSYPSNSRFIFDYYWSYTFFRYSLDNTDNKMFLGCDSTGMVTLVDGMQSTEYPNPQALFILNEI